MDETNIVYGEFMYYLFLYYLCDNTIVLIFIYDNLLNSV